MSSSIWAGARSGSAPMKAIQQKDPFILREWLSSASTTIKDIDQTDEDGRTPLHWAAACGFLKGVQLLLSHQASPNTSDDEGYTPLHSACSCGHLAVVQTLVANPRTDLNALTFSSKLSPLHVAAAKGATDVVVELIRAYSDRKKAKDTSSSSSSSDSSSSSSSMPSLSSFVNQPDKWGNTALMKACSKGVYPCVCALLEFKADASTVNSDGDCALHFATERESEDIVRALLEKSASFIEIQNKQQMTPLDVASSRFKPVVQEILHEL